MPPTYLFVGDEMLTVFLQLLNVILLSLKLLPTIPPIYHVLPVIVPLLVQFSNFELLVMVTVLPVALPTMPPTYLSPVTEPKFLQFEILNTVLYPEFPINPPV